MHSIRFFASFSLNVGRRACKRRRSSGRKPGMMKKVPTWTHTFVCLASTTQDTIPDGEERATLQIAGLGEKSITFPAFSDAQEIYQDLLYNFPKLSKAGGFELLRVPEGGGKQLNLIASPESGYTVAYLKAVVHHAKVYIRPMQQSLPLDPVKETVMTV